MNDDRPREPKSVFRCHAARVSYWLLFVFLPITGLLAWRGIKNALPFVLPLFLVLVLIGEHAFRPWKRLWGVPEE